MIQNRTIKKDIIQVAQNVYLNVEGLSAAVIELTGTFVGTTIFEYTINGTDWYTFTVAIIGSATTATGATAIGKWSAAVSGMSGIRVRCSAFTSGTISVFLRAIANSSASSGAAGGSDATAANQATQISLMPTSLGQKTMANSFATVIASDQSILPVGGNVASGASNAGNPVKGGAVYNSTLPTVTTGQIVDLQTGSRGSLRVQLMTPDGTTGAIVNSAPTDATSGNAGLIVISQNLVWNGASYDRLRTANIVKTATATASGDTAAWTPTSAKKFRLMKYRIEVTADAATSGGADIDVTLRDATTGLNTTTTVYVPAVGGTVFAPNSSTGWIDLDNGLVSALANNVLNVNLSAALTAGKVRVVVAGTEE